MTSKSSYFNPALFCNRSKKNFWAGLLCFVILFFNYPVNLMMTLTRPVRNDLPAAELAVYRTELLTTRVNRVFAGSGTLIIVLLIGFACLFAIVAFSYLHSRTQVDFYHAQPVRRTALFLQNYVMGFLLFAVPFLLNILLSFLCILFSGNVGYLHPGELFAHIGLVLFAFVCIYSLCVFAGMLTGTILAHILGSVTLACVLPLVYILYNATMELCYRNFTNVTMPSRRILEFSSPLIAFVRAFVAPGEQGIAVSTMLFHGVLAALLVAAAWLLYQKRPSEAAGKTISFYTAKPFIKYTLVSIATFGSGYFFRSISYQYQELWLLFGMICGAVLSFGLIQIIFESDFRAAFRNLKGFFIYAAVFAAVFCIPGFDLTGFDRYVPEQKQVKSVSIYVPGYDNMFFDRYYSMETSNLLNAFTYADPETIEKILAVCQEGVNSPEEEADTVSMIYVQYNLKNGGKPARNYTLSAETLHALYPSLYESQEHKQALEVSGLLPGSMGVGGVAVSDIEGVTLISTDKASYLEKTMTLEQGEALVSALRQDLLDTPLDRIAQEVAVCYISVLKQGGKRSEPWSYSYNIPRYSVYPSFTRTIALLNEYEIPYYTLDKADIKQIEVNYEGDDYDSGYAGEKDDNGDIIAEEVSRVSVKITDHEEIKELMQIFVFNEQRHQNPFIEYDNDYYVICETASDLGDDGYSYRGWFRKGTIPLWLTERIKEEAVSVR